MTVNKNFLNNSKLQTQNIIPKPIQKKIIVQQKNKIPKQKPNMINKNGSTSIGKMQIQGENNNKNTKEQTVRLTKKPNVEKSNNSNNLNVEHELPIYVSGILKKQSDDEEVTTESIPIYQNKS